MIRMMAAGAVALMGIVGSAAAADAPAPQASLMTVKIAVADFQKSTDFYVKYFGMKQGAKYNEAEQGVDWPTPGQGSNLILVNDPTGKLKLTPGTAWIMFKVPDAKKMAKAMVDAGFKGVEAPIEMKEYQTIVVNARDPDGNQIEMLQVGPAR
ncbi:MAG: Glyoxalase/Bleomycin resistance protein/Dioxygenase superfamily [Rhodospirillales bacterium]|nr:Glyoxalase/Bleomycin resistance protein/Dioxygenase superfamily [Rhodospirillales bacterium]